MQRIPRASSIAIWISLVLGIATGRVIGVINMVLVKAGRESALSAPTGISYAVPVAALRALMAEARP